MDRPRILRLLRIAFSTVCGIACLLLVVLWVRSYWKCDLIEGGSGSQHFILVSCRGFIGVGGEPNFRSFAMITAWEYESYPPDYDEALPEPFYFGFHFRQDQNSTVVISPFWFPVLLSATIAICPWICWSTRFSLRTLLIATALVAVVLGFAVLSR
jgi:hypothetical protein